MAICAPDAMVRLVVVGKALDEAMISFPPLTLVLPEYVLEAFSVTLEVEPVLPTVRFPGNPEPLKSAITALTIVLPEPARVKVPLLVLEADKYTLPLPPVVPPKVSVPELRLLLRV